MAYYSTNQNSTFVKIANRDLNRVLVTVSSALSLIGVMVIILTYKFIKEIRTVSRHIIVCISISDFFSCMSNVGGLLISSRSPTSPTECKWQSFFGTTGILCSFLWSMVLAIYLYVVIVKENQSIGKILVIPTSHIVCWCLPLVINIIAFWCGKLGNDGDGTTSGWYWIATSDDNDKPVADDIIMWMLIDGKAIEIMTYFVIFVLYVLIKLHLKTKIRNFDRYHSPYCTFVIKGAVDAAKQTEKKLIFIPVFLIVLRIWGTIRFFLYIFNKDWSNTFTNVLLYMQAVGDNLMGFINCLLFCVFTPKVWRRIKACCCKACKTTFRICFDREEEYDDGDDDYDHFHSETSLDETHSNA